MSEWGKAGMHVQGKGWEITWLLQCELVGKNGVDSAGCLGAVMFLPTSGLTADGTCNPSTGAARKM